jgi:biopolymer transport protein ExbB
MSKQKFMILGILLTMTYFCYMSVQAQNANEAGAAQKVVKTEKIEVPDSTLWGTIKTGGITMVPLGLLAIGTIALTIYGFIFTQEKKMLQPQVIPNIQTSLEALNIQEASNICAGNPCLLTNIMLSGIQRLSDGYLDVESMEKAMEEASVEETAAGLKPINYLSIIAQIAPMLGLLGTVSGMIKAFDKIGKGGMGKPEALAGNIGEAMITTATGLIIGIPAMFFYFFLKGKYLSNVSRLARMLGNLSHSLVSASRRAGDETAGEEAYE